jgi:ABC-type transporter Mla subunit MlaD
MEKPAQALAPRNGHWVVILIVAVGLATVGVFSYLKHTAPPSFSLKTCFQDANGLRPGAAVRLAGVDVGRVRSVRAQPADHACPAAVEMQLQADYELKIPRDSVASIATAGLLGETYLEIDVSGASGQPIPTDGQLPSKESVKFTAATLDRMLKAVELVKRLSDEEKASQPSPPDKKLSPEAPARSPSK